MMKSQKFAMPDTKQLHFTLKLGPSYLQQRPGLLKTFSSLWKKEAFQINWGPNEDQVVFCDLASWSKN